MDETLDDMTRALNAVKAIDDAVAEMSRRYPKTDPMRVQWEHDDPDAAEFLRVNPGCYLFLSGALEYLGQDVQMSVRLGGDDDGRPDRVAILAVLDEPLVLPPDPGELCDALACCLDRSIIPEMHHDEDAGEIVLDGLTVIVPIESLSGRILRDALDRLNKATVLLRTYLFQDNGDEQRPIDGPIA